MYLTASGKAMKSFLSLLFLQQGYSLKTNLDRCATATEAFTEADFFPDKAKLKDATTFSISYHGTYKVITNIAQNEKYLLYQCGTNPPSDTSAYRIVTPIPLPDGLALTSTGMFMFNIYFTLLIFKVLSSIYFNDISTNS